MEQTNKQTNKQLRSGKKRGLTNTKYVCNKNDILELYIDNVDRLVDDKDAKLL